VTLLRTFLADMPGSEAIDFLLKQMSRSKNNREFFVQMREG
jgi:transcription termination factor Rho